MRYNIKRLFNEVVTHERSLEKFENGTHNASLALSQKNIEFEMNSLRHAIALCKKLIGEEVVARWKEGTNLNKEYEDVPIIKFN